LVSPPQIISTPLAFPAFALAHKPLSSPGFCGSSRKIFSLTVTPPGFPSHINIPFCCDGDSVLTFFQFDKLLLLTSPPKVHVRSWIFSKQSSPQGFLSGLFSPPPPPVPIPKAPAPGRGVRGGSMFFLFRSFSQKPSCQVVFPLPRFL